VADSEKEGDGLGFLFLELKLLQLLLAPLADMMVVKSPERVFFPIVLTTGHDTDGRAQPAAKQASHQNCKKTQWPAILSQFDACIQECAPFPVRATLWKIPKSWHTANGFPWAMIIGAGLV